MNSTRQNFWFFTFGLFLTAAWSSQNSDSCEKKKVKVAFFVNYLSVRGTEVAIFDYADFNETLLGNESIIICYTYYNKNHISADPRPYNSAQKKFKDRFYDRYFECSSMDEMDGILVREHVDILYQLKAGPIDGKISKVCKNAIHAVFPEIQVHGDVYACISHWLSNQYPQLHLPYVPHMVRLPDVKEDLRVELGIPSNAIVFGRHGGNDSFDILFVKKAVIEVAQKRNDCYFLFLNTDKFCDLPNVIYLPATADMIYKTKFINTCDAMLHARSRGETFGLACAEFSIKNKPVITWDGSPERCHIDILKEKGIYYATKTDLLKILYTFMPDATKNWDAYSVEYNPDVVMRKFDEVFIRPLMPEFKCINDNL